MSRDPIERSLEIEQAQLRGFARTIAEVEWLLLILVVLYLFIANPALARSPGVLGVLLGFAAFVLLFRYWRPFATRTHFKLAFEILGVQSLGADGAIVLGRWVLTETPNAGSGVFSVALRRTQQGWLVVHDHTSSDG